MVDEFLAYFDLPKPPARGEDELMSMTQTNESNREFVRKFQNALYKASYTLSDEALTKRFLNALRPRVANEVRKLGANFFRQAVDSCLKLEAFEVESGVDNPICASLAPPPKKRENETLDPISSVIRAFERTLRNASNQKKEGSPSPPRESKDVNLATKKAPPPQKGKKYCAYHKSTRHSTEDCKALKKKKESTSDEEEETTSLPNKEQAIHKDPFPDHEQKKDQRTQEKGKWIPRKNQEAQSNKGVVIRDTPNQDPKLPRYKGKKQVTKEIFLCETGQTSNVVIPAITELPLLPPRQPRVDFTRPIPQTRNFSIVEELKTVSAGISLFDVLKACPDQVEALLEALDIPTTPLSPTLATFDLAKAPKVDPSNVPNFFISAFLQPSDEAGGVFIHKALVDEGSSVNLMPWDIYDQMDPKPELQKCDFVCTGYEGSALSPVGKIQLRVELEGKEVLTEFAVLNRHFSFNILLGRPWIAQMQAVISSIYGELQFIHNGHLQRVKRYSPLQQDVAHVTHLENGEAQHVIETRGVGHYYVGRLFDSDEVAYVATSPTSEREQETLAQLFRERDSE